MSSFVNPLSPRRVRSCVVISFLHRIDRDLFVHTFSCTDRVASRSFRCVVRASLGLRSVCRIASSVVQFAELLWRRRVVVR